MHKIQRSVAAFEKQLKIKYSYSEYGKNIFIIIYHTLNVTSQVVITIMILSKQHNYKASNEEPDVKLLQMKHNFIILHDAVLSFLGG